MRQSPNALGAQYTRGESDDVCNNPVFYWNQFVVKRLNRRIRRWRFSDGPSTNPFGKYGLSRTDRYSGETVEGDCRTSVIERIADVGSQKNSDALVTEVRFDWTYRRDVWRIPERKRSTGGMCSPNTFVDTKRNFMRKTITFPLGRGILEFIVDRTIVVLRSPERRTDATARYRYFPIKTTGRPVGSKGADKPISPTNAIPFRPFALRPRP